MKVAVVTPYYKETSQQLQRCIHSVAVQTYQATHFMVADGFPCKLPEIASTVHIQLPNSHNDAGATPRAIGALSAFSQGFDAVSFLDADNWYNDNHIAEMVNTMQLSKADAVVATRTIHTTTGVPLYVDRIESNGENMVDTNCMFISRAASTFMSFWVTPPEHRLVSDRVFWQACIMNGLKAVRNDTPTVAYASKWAWHYQHAGVPIPDDAVWMEQDQSGNYKQIKHKDRRIII